MDRQKPYSLNNFGDFTQDLFRRITSIETRLNQQTEQPTDYSKIFLTLDEAAKFIGVKPATMYAKNKNQEIPYVKAGKLLYCLSDLLEYLKARKVKSTTQIQDSISELVNQPSVKKRIY